MKRFLWLVLFVICAGLVAGAWYRESLWRWLRHDPSGSTQDVPAVAADSSVRQDVRAVWALGRLEPAGGTVEIGAIPGDRLLELSVAAGDAVRRGQILGKLESEVLRADEVRMIETQLEQARRRHAAEQAAAEAKLAIARIQEEQASVVGDLGIEAERKRCAALTAAVDQASKDLERATILVRDAPDLISQQEMERLALLHHKAAADLEAAEAALNTARKTSEFQKQLAVAQRKAAELALQQIRDARDAEALEQQWEAAKARLDRSRLRSPVDGRVLRVYAEPSELLGQRPILQIADVSRMICVAEVSHDQIARIRLGQEAWIESRAFQDSPEPLALKGHVDSIGIMAGSPELRPLDPFAPSDRHTVEVRIVLDEKGSEVAGRFVNLQVDVRFPQGAPGKAAP